MSRKPESRPDVMLADKAPVIARDDTSMHESASGSGGRGPGRAMPAIVPVSLRLKTLRERAGYSLIELATAIDKPVSTYKAYERHSYKQEFVNMRLIRLILPLLVGRGDPPITEAEILALAGHEPGVYASVLLGRNDARQPSAKKGKNLPDVSQVSMPVDVPFFEAIALDRGFAMNLREAPLMAVTRPPGLSAQVQATAFYATDDTMTPWREAGEAVYVHHTRPAAVGCHVIVRLRSADLTLPDVWLLRRLVGREAGAVTLGQYNPPLTETLPAADVAQMLRVIEWPELLGLMTV